jgi:hypothetical protein
MPYDCTSSSRTSRDPQKAHQAACLSSGVLGTGSMKSMSQGLKSVTMQACQPWPAVKAGTVLGTRRRKCIANVTRS